MRVMRESCWGKLINKQVTRWVGSRQIDMRGHGTQKTRTVHQPCAKQDTNTQNEKTHKPRIHRRQDNMKARNQWNTQAACHTAQDITWMHAADRNTNCVQHNKTHVDRRARSRADSRPRTHTMTENGARVSEPRHENRISRHECRDPNTTLQHETRYADERKHTARALSKPRALTWKQDMTGVSGLCHKTTNNPRPKWQNPDNRKFL